MSWTLNNIDNIKSAGHIIGQFDPKIQRGIGSPIWQVKPGVLGAPQWLKFIGKNVGTINFEFLYIATNILDQRGVANLRLLQELAGIDETLGRPPRVLFSYGPVVIEGFITGIPDSIPILYWGNGRNLVIGKIPRQVGPFQVTMHEINRPIAELSPFTNFVAKTDETKFEELAKMQYGDARYAQTLAMHNQGVKIGETLEIPRKRSGIVSKVTPIAAYLDDTEIE